MTEYPASETVAKADIAYVASGSTYLDPNNKLCGFTKTLNCESTVEVSYKVNLTNFVAAYGADEIANLEFRVSYKEPSKTNTDVTPTVISYTAAQAAEISGNYYTFLANNIVSSMMPSQTNIDVYYNGTWIAGSVYSINYYLYNFYDSTTVIKTGATANLGEICKAIATYGASARTYFGSVA